MQSLLLSVSPYRVSYILSPVLFLLHLSNLQCLLKISLSCFFLSPISSSHFLVSSALVSLSFHHSLHHSLTFNLRRILCCSRYLGAMKAIDNWQICSTAASLAIRTRWPFRWLETAEDENVRNEHWIQNKRKRPTICSIARFPIFLKYFST